MTTPTYHATTVTVHRSAGGDKEHMAHCTCGWEYISTSKPDVAWKARMHRATHAKDTS